LPASSTWRSCSSRPRSSAPAPPANAILVAVYGLGVAAGSLTCSNGGTLGELKRRYLAGLALTAAAFCACGLALAYGAAAVAFALCGIGAGLVLVHERLLLQVLVPDALLGRVFGVKDALQCWAFAPGFVCAGALVSLLGTRALLLLAGAGVLLVWCAASLALRQAWGDESRLVGRSTLSPLPAGS
jgi:MFS family permease